MTIEFLSDETQEKNKQEIDKILKEFVNPEIKKNAEILLIFTKALLKASLPKEEIIFEIPEIKKQIIKPEVIIPKPTPKPVPKTLPKLETPIEMDISPIPEPSNDLYKQPLLHFEVIKKQGKLIELPTIIPLIVDKKTNKVMARAEIKNNNYILTEPILNEDELKLLDNLKKEIKGGFLSNPEKKLKNKEKLINLTKKLSEKLKLTYSDDLLAKMKYYLFRDILSLGKIKPLLHDKDINSIFYTPNLVEVNYKNQKLKTNISLNKEELNNLIEKIAEKTKNKISKKSSNLETTYKSFKIQATLGTDKTDAKLIITKI